MIENQEFRKVYRSLDQFILILLIVALPIFGMTYLYHSSGTLSWDLPELPFLIAQLLAVVSVGLLIAQYFLFRKRVKAVLDTEDLLVKLKIYAKATRNRYSILFLVTLISSIGLLLTESAIFTVIFAIALFYFSVAKPTPGRINALFKLNKEDAEVIRSASRPD